MGYNEIQRNNCESICILQSKSNFGRCPGIVSTFPTNYGRAFSWTQINGLNVDIFIDYRFGIHVNKMWISLNLFYVQQCVDWVQINTWTWFAGSTSSDILWIKIWCILKCYKIGCWIENGNMNYIVEYVYCKS